VSVLQRSYPRDRARYPQAVGCLMWWGLFTASLSGYLLFFFAMSWYKGEIGSGQICTNDKISCIAQNVWVPIIAFGVLFISQLFMVYLVEARKRQSSLAATYSMLVVSMILLPVFGTIVGLYLLVRLANDPQTRAYYASSERQETRN
jgi:uncharacterized membrane protein